MSFTQKVTNKAGTEKTVVADDESDLKAAVEAVKNEKAPVTVDINVPVPKGRDLLVVEEDGITQGLSDGRGAHNSPRTAVRDDGTVEGDPDVPVVVQTRNVGTAQATTDSLQQLGKDGKLTDLSDADKEKAQKATSK